MHFNAATFCGQFTCTASDTLQLRATTWHAPALPFTEVCLQTKPALALPWWLRAYAAAGAALCTHLQPCLSTCVRHTVQPRAGTTAFSTSIVNFNTWTLELPYCPSIPLEHVIGMRAVHVVLVSDGVEVCSAVIQQRKRCSQLKH